MPELAKIFLPADQLEGTEAAFSAWLVSEGDRVEKGLPIAELETDKVAMEVCAPASGVVVSLSAKVGDKIEPEQSLGEIDTAELKIDKPVTQLVDSSISVSTGEDSDEVVIDLKTPELIGAESISPAVRRLLHENNLQVEQVTGTGKRGRVSRDDVILYLQSAKETATRKFEDKPIGQEGNIGLSPFENKPPVPRKPKGTLRPHTNIRKTIANHMVNSLLETSPHVTSVFEMDMGNIIEHRKWHKKEYSALDVNLTFTAYFLAAMAEAVANVPQVNAKFHDDALELFDDVNIGVGTALGDSGLVVPVVHQVQSLNLLQIAKSLNQQTEKARTGNLKPSDMTNGTLTISNHGVSGSLFATPIIINQPQVAILGVGKMEKRVVVESVDGVDNMVIRPKCYVSLSIDHRALDAHQTNLYLSKFVDIIENWGI